MTEAAPAWFDTSLTDFPRALSPQSCSSVYRLIEISTSNESRGMLASA